MTTHPPPGNPPPSSVSGATGPWSDEQCEAAFNVASDARYVLHADAANSAHGHPDLAGDISKLRVAEEWFCAKLAKVAHLFAPSSVPAPRETHALETLVLRIESLLADEDRANLLERARSGRGELAEAIADANATLTARSSIR